MPIDLKLRPDLILRTRIQVLHDVMRELAQGFSASDATLDTIRKGILDRQLLKSVELNYVNASGKAVGRAKMVVNWRDYTFFAQAPDGKNLGVDPTRSLAEQISDAYQHLIWHTRELRHAFGVLTTEVRYVFRDDIQEDPAQLADARSFLGTRPADPIPWAVGVSGNARPDFSIQYSADALRELSIYIDNVKPR